jgi:hypothetical protein
MPSPVVNVTVNLCACQAAVRRRRSSNPSDPSTRARTLPRLFGSISGTGEGATCTSPIRQPLTSVVGYEPEFQKTVYGATFEAAL